MATDLQMYVMMISEEKCKELVRMPKDEAKKWMIANRPQVLDFRYIHTARPMEIDGKFCIEYLYS